MTKVKPTLPKGFKDYSPEQMLARNEMLLAIARVMRLFGFVPLQTSSAQRRMVLSGGKPLENIVYNLRVPADHAIAADEGDEDDPQTVRALRFDLTVPLARYVAEHMGKIPFPFRRYEMGNVFRGENPQKGRFREFMQFDADIVGAPVGAADAEIILCMAAIMRALGIERFLVKVNNRKILNGFAERVGFLSGSPEASALLRVMDKADKVGIDGVLAELRSWNAPESKETPLFDDARCDLVRGFMTLTDGLATNAERLAAMSAYFGDEGIGTEGVRELELIAALLAAGGMPEHQWAVDASIARGLGYYTGPVFETVLLGHEKFGSVLSGGRYDDLVARFTDKSLPAVGASVGVDRLFAALEEIGTLRATEPAADAFILNLDKNLAPNYFSMAQDLRGAGVRVEIGTEGVSQKSQTKIAIESRHAPVLVVFDARDAAKGLVGVRDTATRATTLAPPDKLVETILSILKKT